MLKKRLVKGSINNGHHRRRGSIYIVVLGVAMIVSLLGLVALKVQRIQRRACNDGFDSVQARLNAQAALRIGMLRIEKDPDWRYNFPNGIWEVNKPLGSGTYSVQGYDPSDADLSDVPEDPLVLVGVGSQGAAVQKTALTLSPENRGLSCLETAMHAGVDIEMTAAQLPNLGTISANNSVIESGASSIAPDVQAVVSVSGDNYRGSVETGVDPREMPESSVFDYYKSHGTWIDISAIVAPPPLNLVQNPGFENGLTGWSASGLALLSINSSESRTGGNSAKITLRLSSEDAFVQTISSGIANGRTYLVEVWAKKELAGTIDVRPELQVSSSAGGTVSLSNGYTSVGTTWTKVTTTITPTWSGSLQSAVLRFETTSGTASFSIDDAVMQEFNPPTRMISRTLLSPADNSFTDATNSLGIYVIDCQGQDIYIENSRIVGTLVLLNPGGNSAIRSGPVNLAAAKGNYPVLLVDGSFKINQTNDGLVESVLGVNFNPAGTGYTGLGTDADTNDTYPSQITGLIYASGEIDFSNQPTVLGAVVAGQSIRLNAAVMQLTHSLSMLRNPPPGFSGPEKIKILLDSARKEID